jgi:Fe-Mn family superoxide dismutase
MATFERRTLLAGAGAVALVQGLRGAQAQPVPTAAGLALRYPFAVPPLPYAYVANEPSVDQATMQLHHDKHHSTYVTNLNAALEAHPELHHKPLPAMLANLSSVPDAIRPAVRNNGGGHVNHTMFWQVMGGRGGEPGGEVMAVINHSFGSLDALKTAFNAAGASQFGSGWAMVVLDRAGKLSVEARPNQDSPMMDGLQLLFGNDVWEHAYYMKYQNRRADYLKAWWDVLDWRRIGERYAEAKAGTLAA